MARNMLGASPVINSITLNKEHTKVRLDPCSAAADEEIHLFKAALTAAAIQHFSLRHKTPAQPRGVTGGQPFHVSMELFSRHFRVALRAQPAHWPALLRALSRLQLVAPVVESTDPVDRVVLDMHLLEGGSVEEAIREFVGVLRAELTGPAA